ncbi:MAG: TonB family protein [Candidatus Omnitrophica bacterium]|nr:TonB family protein [Candidatus Omnitrophota bacterium]MDD5237600.1 TonB family protein [Candidatus Omnitrophota bacterium]
MLSNRVFQICLLASLIAHSVILIQNSSLNPFFTSKKEQKIELSYVKIPKQPKKETKTESPSKDPFLKIPPKITLDKKIPPPFIDTDNKLKTNKSIALQNPVFSKPEFAKPDIIAIKKKITLPAIKMEQSNNPTYMGYYQLVREKIKRAAYQNYSRNETGEVYLSFIISSDGYIKEVHLIEDKSSSNPYLKEIALRSIKDASPFPNFPKDLDYPYLSFNVVVSFEIE